MENLEGLRDEILAAVGQAADLDALEGARISALGRKGRITTLMKGLAALAADERRGAGQTPGSQPAPSLRGSEHRCSSTSASGSACPANTPRMSSVATDRQPPDLNSS